MSQRFIKYIPGEASQKLKKKNIWAWLLLCQIVERVRWTDDPIEGLNKGECYIGDYREAGIPTIQNYKTAKKLLVNLLTIEIIETCRNRKKSTTGSTTVGTKVKLLHSSIWDLNLDNDNHRSNHRLTTDQPPANHEQEGEEREEDKEDLIDGWMDQGGKKIKNVDNSSKRMSTNYELNHERQKYFLEAKAKLEPDSVPIETLLEVLSQESYPLEVIDRALNRFLADFQTSKKRQSRGYKGIISPRGLFISQVKEELNSFNAEIEMLLKQEALREEKEQYIGLMKKIAQDAQVRLGKDKVSVGFDAVRVYFPNGAAKSQLLKYELQDFETRFLSIIENF